MVKETFIIIGAAAAGALVVCAIIALAKKIMSNKEEGITPERAYESELTINVIKAWFKDKIVNENFVGVIFYPSEENIKKYKINVDINDHMIIQLIYDTSCDAVVSYREVAFGELSEKLKKLMDDNGGTLVIEK